MVAFVSDPAKEGSHYVESASEHLQTDLFQSYEEFEDEAQELFKVCFWLRRFF